MVTWVAFGPFMNFCHMSKEEEGGSETHVDGEVSGQLCWEENGAEAGPCRDRVWGGGAHCAGMDCLVPDPLSEECTLA